MCVNLPRIYDSCGAKDCLNDLTVFFTAENQALIDSASSVRINRASVLTATVEVDTVAFHRGFYSVDMMFYFGVSLDVYGSTNTIPDTVTGLAVYGKRVVLYGSEANVKSFSSQTDSAVDSTELDGCQAPVSMPEGTVQISNPMALSARLAPVTSTVNLPVIPENIQNYFGESLVAPTGIQALVTLGIFTITQLQRDVQLMIPSYDFCMPRKECSSRTDDPCEAFSKIEFPADSFFPPNSSECRPSENPFDCGC